MPRTPARWIRCAYLRYGAASYLLVLLSDGGAVAALAVKNAGYAALDIAVIGLSAYLVRDRNLPAAWIALCPSVGVFAGQLLCELLSYGARCGLYGAPAIYATEMFVLLAGGLDQALDCRARRRVRGARAGAERRPCIKY